MDRLGAFSQVPDLDSLLSTKADQVVIGRAHAEAAVIVGNGLLVCQLYQVDGLS